MQDIQVFFECLKLDLIISNGLQFPLGFTSPDISTGCCTIFVEDDGTRTMCTFLGAGTLIGPEDIHLEHITNHKIAYLEGYLWDNQDAKMAMKKMVDICKSDNQFLETTLFINTIYIEKDENFTLRNNSV